MKKLSTNVLVIGRSGVGKSSLLNYLFNKEIQKIGVGKPVTEKGIFPCDYQYDENFRICIYDTWGLEPDKAAEWEQLICDEVARHDKRHIREWFNTIIYCLSANSNRVEDFELNMLEKLVNSNNQVVVAITHCEKRDDQRAETMKEIIAENTEVKREQVIFVNNVEKQLIGNSVSKFGREEVFIMIIKNLWESLKQKVPFNIKQQMAAAFHEKRNDFSDTIKKQRLLFRRNKKLNEFEKNVNSEFEDFINEEIENINTRFKDAMNYYNELSTQYAEIGLLERESITNMPEMHFEALEQFKKEVNEQVQSIANSAGEIIVLLKKDISKKVLKNLGYALKKYFSSSKKIKNTLEDTVNEHLREMERHLCNEIGKIKKELQKINIEKISALMLSEGYKNS